MRRIEARPWRESFFSGTKEPAAAGTPVFLRLRHLGNPLVFVAALMVLLALSSPFSRVSRVALGAVTVTAVYLYYRTRAIAEGLYLRRLIKREFFTEHDEVDVQIEIQNASLFAVTAGLVVEDHFEPSLDAHARLIEERALPAESRIFTRYRKKCDAGMGRHQIGPLSVRVTDLLNLFEFRVIEDELSEAHVYPRIITVQRLELNGTPDSSSYGIYEVASRGTSVNFAGVRPFVNGDSLRQIAWRVSAKRDGDLMVKEFEKIANCDVTVALNLDPRLHVGYKSHSTWEAAKDIALSLVSQQVDIGNSIQVCANQLYVEPARGSEHFQYLCRQMMAIMPREEEMTAKIDDVLARYRHVIAPGSALIYISVYDETEYAAALPRLRALQTNGVRVTCIFLDGAAYLQSLSGVTTDAAILLRTKNPERLRERAIELETHGMRAFIVRSNSDIEKLFSKATRAKGRVHS